MANIGKHTVAINPYSDEEIGDFSVVIRPAPGETSVVYNRGGTAVGYNARADETSIAIGSNAMAGSFKKLI